MWLYVSDNHGLCLESSYPYTSSNGDSGKCLTDCEVIPDTNVIDHVVVISNLTTSQVFHLQAISKDNAGNIGKSESRTTIIGQATENVFNIVFNALKAIFGL
jgi:hypothetical protein